MEGYLDTLATYKKYSEALSCLETLLNDIENTLDDCAEEDIESVQIYINAKRSVKDSIEKLKDSNISVFNKIIETMPTWV